MTQTTRGICVAVCALFFIDSLSNAAEPHSVAEPEVIGLEPFVVEASAENPWQIVSIPGYEILSRCPEKFTWSCVRALNRAEHAREALLPAGFWGRFGAPIKVILYNQEPKPSAGFLGGNPIDLSWSSESGASLGYRTILLSHPPVVGDGDLFITCGNYRTLRAEADELSVDPDSVLRLRCRVPRLPPWFLSGIQGQFGLYSKHVIESNLGTDSLMLPSAVWISLEKTEELKKAWKLAKRKKLPPPATSLLPLKELFASKAASDDVRLWESETALFLRWALFGRESDGRDHRAAFLNFADAASREMVSEELFGKHFGFGYYEAEKKLRIYLGTAVAEPISVPLAGVTSPGFSSRDATSSEVSRIIGDWTRLEARVLSPFQGDLRQEYLDRAEQIFNREFKKNTRDPLFLAEFGLYTSQQGDKERAREALEVATSARIIRPRAYVELARIKLNALVTSITPHFGDLSDANYAEIMDLLSTARRQMPGFLLTYKIIVEALEHAPTKPTLQDLAPLEEAVHLFPREADLLRRVTALYDVLGYSEKSAEMRNWARSIALNEMPTGLRSRGVDTFLPFPE